MKLRESCLVKNKRHHQNGSSLNKLSAGFHGVLIRVKDIRGYFIYPLVVISGRFVVLKVVPFVVLVFLSDVLAAVVAVVLSVVLAVVVSVVLLVTSDLTVVVGLIVELAK